MIALVKVQGGELVRTLPRGSEIQVVFRLPEEKEADLIGTLREWGAKNLHQNDFRDEAGNWVVILRKH
jgi:hypothetical protein